MLQQPQRLYEFGSYCLDPAQQLLLDGARKIALTPKAFQTLLVLVENKGRIVSKEELLQKVWPDTFVEEASLTQNIFTLRQQLHDDRLEALYIETVPKRGYRFVASVQEIGVGDAVPADRALAASARVAAPTRRRNAYLLPISTGVLLTALLALGYLVSKRSDARPNPVAHRVMLAVLPVQNLTGDAEKEYITDGVTEEIVARLGSENPSKLGVIARTSSMTYKHSEKTVLQIGRELGVDYVLESGLRASGDRIRVTAQLIRTRDQTHVWAKVYDRTATDILAVQDDVARAVSHEIQVSLLSEDKTRRTASAAVDAQAYDAYLRGRFYWNKRSPKDMVTAANYFEQAIQKAPNYALAYAGLSDTYQLMVFWGQLTLKDGSRRAKAAAEKALELDGRLAEAHTTLASIKEAFDWDWVGAEAEYRRALELNPNYATAHHWYAEFLAGHGRFDQSMAEIIKAQEVDPLPPVIARSLGEMHCRMGSCEKAITQYEKVLQMYPAYPQASYLLAQAYARMGMYEQAVEQIARAQAGPKLNAGWASSTRAYAAAVSGHTQEALRLIPRVKKDTDPQYADYNLATIYAALGNKDEAFASLERARRAHDVTLSLVKCDYRLDNIKMDPRFNDFLGRMNF